ncbi:MAG: DUF1295 domain-containing protein [Bacteroidetes bacterium]|nr:DUF1295 domain-containing protein [Bacteroidota bacterium]
MGNYNVMISLQTFNILVYIWIAMAILLFPVLLKITAPYGRHTRKDWGPMINNRTGWILMELPALVIFGFFLISGENLGIPIIFTILILWVLHYFHRSLIYPFRISLSDKKMPVIIMLFAVFFNCINGFINGYWFGSLSPGYPIAWMEDPRFILGIILFIIGFLVNQYHDRILLSLRKHGDKGYQIPRRGLFRFVSCPNFLGEIIEWGGFALMTWCLPSFSFFIWTFVNLIPRALDHHRWYRQQFDNYPQNRKAIIPYLL